MRPRISAFFETLMAVLEVTSLSRPSRRTKWLNAAWLRFLSINATAAIIVGRVKGTADISGRKLLEISCERVQRVYRCGEIRLVAIDHVALEVGVAVREHLVLWQCRRWREVFRRAGLSAMPENCCRVSRRPPTLLHSASAPNDAASQYSGGSCEDRRRAQPVSGRALCARLPIRSPHATPAPQTFRLRFQEQMSKRSAGSSGSRPYASATNERYGHVHCLAPQRPH